MKEYERLASKLFDGEPPESFIDLLDDINKRIIEMKPDGELRSSQTIALAYAVWVRSQRITEVMQ